MKTARLVERCRNLAAAGSTIAMFAAVGCGGSTTQTTGAVTGTFTSTSTDCTYQVETVALDGAVVDAGTAIKPCPVICGVGTALPTALCTGATTFPAAPWTSSATALLTGCQTGEDAGIVPFPTYTCAYYLAAPPCGPSSFCGSITADAATAGLSSGTATGTSTGP